MGWKKIWRVCLYIKGWIKCEGLPLQKNRGQVKSLWVRISDKSNKGIPVVGIYCRSRGLYSQRLLAPATGGITLLSTLILAEKIAQQTAGNPENSGNPWRTMY